MSKPEIKFYDVIESELGWIDISTLEKKRVYIFSDGKYEIDEPCKLLITRKPNGDSHRIIDSNGRRHYIRAGWLGFYFDGEWGKMTNGTE